MTTSMRVAFSLRASTLAELEAHARETYPDECCGLIFQKNAEEAVRRIRNSQDEEHARDPERHPRTARTAYYMDGEEVVRVFREMDTDGWSLSALYHSHPDHAAYFSEEDKERGLIPEGPLKGEPWFPGASYLILSAWSDGIRDIKAFRWDGDAGNFLEVPIAAAPF